MSGEMSPDPDKDEESDDESDDGVKIEGAYDPAAYADLDVGGDIKELFSYIERYAAQTQEIETRLKPFIPDYIPAVGDIDAMIKVGPPNADQPDYTDLGLGLVVLDEPCAAQSDPTVLDLQLRSISKTKTGKAVAVKAVRGGADGAKVVENWVQSISDIHRDKPPQSVSYSSQMPEIDTLMQEWPPEFEALLKSVQLPSAELNVNLEQYTSIISALCDIPVHKGNPKARIEALHLLFTLYSEFKTNEHFRTREDSDGADEELPPTAEAEVMVM